MGAEVSKPGGAIRHPEIGGRRSLGFSDWFYWKLLMGLLVSLPTDDDGTVSLWMKVLDASFRCGVALAAERSFCRALELTGGGVMRSWFLNCWRLFT